MAHGRATIGAIAMITINTLINLLAKVSCQENRLLSLHSSRHGYAVVADNNEVVIPADDSIASLYESIEERYYRNMYTLFTV